MTQIAVAEDRFDSAPIGKQSQVGIRRGHALRHRSADRCSTVGQALPYRLHARLVPYERGTGAGFARRVVSLVCQVRVQHQRRARIGKEPAVAGVDVAFRRQPLGQQDGVLV